LNKTIKLAVRDFAVPTPRSGSLEFSSGYQDSLLDGYRFQVEGRADGLFVGENPRIEEIKSSFNIWDLSKKLKQKELHHSYVLQLATYAKTMPEDWFYESAQELVSSSILSDLEKFWG